MAGGIGARFWPMSRTSHPKQFIDILGTGETLIQQTYKRFAKIINTENIYIVTNEAYKSLVKEQIPGISDEQILGEPARRNTAPCIAYANYRILARDPEACIVVAPSDHIILKEEIFLENILTALQAAEEHDWLLTLGIRPSRPDTGYGYIQFEEGMVYPKDLHLKKVKTFTEKPNLELATTFIKCGDFLWNAGIFVWSLKSIMKAFSDFLPEINILFRKGIGYYGTTGESAFINEAYGICKSISIDYGIMEKAGNVYVVKGDFGWSDVGSWDEVVRLTPTDDAGNSIRGRTILVDSNNNYVDAGKKIVATIGVDDLIIISTDDAILVCKKERSQEVKEVVDFIRRKQMNEYL